MAAFLGSKSRFAPIVFVVIALVLAACNGSGGGGSSGY
jgi:predicted small secreted protein